MAQMSEKSIIDSAFFLFEKDATPWAITDDEYLTARGLANIAIGRWEFYENTKWRDLWTTLADSDVALGGVKTVTANTYSYACPSDMRYPASYVRIEDQPFSVVPVENVPALSTSSSAFCWFTGNIKSGFKLHINPNCALNTGDSIDYEYYKQATKFTSSTDTTEMQDPYMIAYFIASHLGDDGVIADFYQMAEARLEQMRTVNMSQLWNTQDVINSPLEDNFGFGQ